MPATDDVEVADLDPTQRRDIERWFIRRGLPHLIVDYSARDDIFTRAMPLLSVVFLVEILNALSPRFAWWGNVLSVLGAIAITLGGLALVNHLRGRRRFQRPDSVGAIELAAFVLVPPLIPLLLRGRAGTALVTMLFNLVLLGIVYLVTSYGLVPTVRWAFGRLGDQISNVLNLMVRSLPLLLLFTMFLFYNAELWKVMDDLPLVLYLAAVGLLFGVGSLFVLLRIPKELRSVSAFGTWDELISEAADTPAGSLGAQALAGDVLAEEEGEDATPVPDPLEPRERINVGLVFFIGQSIQILLVTLLIFAFYVAFGLLTILASTIELWTGSAQIGVLATFDVAGTQLLLSTELLRTAGFIAAVAGLQFTVSALIDEKYRAEFLDEFVAELSQAFAVRFLYRRVVLTPGEVREPS